jgi:hypothetical protein
MIILDVYLDIILQMFAVVLQTMMNAVRLGCVQMANVSIWMVPSNVSVTVALFFHHLDIHVLVRSCLSHV